MTSGSIPKCAGCSWFAQTRPQRDGGEIDGVCVPPFSLPLKTQSLTPCRRRDPASDGGTLLFKEYVQ